MPGLVELDFPIVEQDLPSDIARLLRIADRRIERFQKDSRVPAFVPSDFPGAYQVLRSLIESPFIRGHQFCEWGSGFGVVATMAAAVGFEATGIEINGDLVHAAKKLATDFGQYVDFAHGSFVPGGEEDRLVEAGEYSWLTTDSDDAYDQLGLEPADLDVVFAYPWPDEEQATIDLFARVATPGAILVTYQGTEFRLHRRIESKRRVRRR